MSLRLQSLRKNPLKSSFFDIYLISAKVFIINPLFEEKEMEIKSKVTRHKNTKAMSAQKTRIIEKNKDKGYVNCNVGKTPDY